MKPCHIALRRRMSEYRGIKGGEENGDDEGMRRGQIMFDRQIKGRENSHDEDS